MRGPFLSPPPINATWAAMGRSLGASSSLEQDAALAALLAKHKHHTLLLVGDSSLRNQFMQLVRIGLQFEKSMPVAEGITKRAHSGSFSLPFPIKNPEKPDSSNGFWGGYPWLAFSTPGNTTVIYAKNWGCSDPAAIVSRMRVIALRHRQRSGGFGGWPPHSVLWNYGLHLLHVFPARPVPLTSVRCALGYRDLVDESARSLRMELPNTRLAYRTTNAVCDARVDGNWAVAARAYHCAAAAVASLGRCTGGCKPTPECMDERLSRVQASCQRRYNATMGECVSTFMDAGNSKQQRDSAKAVLEGHGGGITLFDAFALTESRCDATVDGRHYPRLLASINERWLTAIL